MPMFHKEGNKIILANLIIVGALNALIWTLLPADIFWVGVGASSVTGIWLLLILQFFRNPSRVISVQDSRYLYAPADGKVVVVEEVEETEYLKKRCLQVSIFMSPLNVHVNRNPTSGKIVYFRYHPGQYLAAWNPKASTENERTTTVYELADGKQYLMRQVAGALAKRICWYVHEGMDVEQGEDMGFIKFGSRVDLYLPLGTKIKVKIGDVVRGNIHLIGEFAD